MSTIRMLADARLLGRHQLAAALATAADFGSMVALVELAGFAPPSATMVSAVAGGVANFTLARGWVFRWPQDRRLGAQALRYAAASLGGAALNALLLALLLRAGLGIPYVVGRCAAAVAVGVLYSYPAHARFVFRPAPHERT